MDVICEQCKAEYDFDETLLGDKGTTVKCSTCGHVFRVVPSPKEPARPLLKLRFTNSGRVEAIASLRELQQRIRAGQVGVDDELGRDGFAYRRLGDVPELKNFFARPTGTPATGNATSTLRPSDATPGRLRVSQTSMPPPPKEDAPRGDAKRTVIGLGPANPQIPGPPRMPNVPGVAPAAGARPHSNGVNQPAKPAAGGAVPISNAPTQPNLRMPPELEPVPFPRGAPTSNAPTSPNAQLPSMPASAQRSGLPAANKSRSLAPPTPSNPVRLYLADDELPPQRASEGGSKTWLYALILLVLGGGGWVAINALSGKGPSEVAPPPPVASRVEAPQVPPSVLPEAPAAAAPGTPPTPPEKTAAAPAAPATPAAPAAAAEVEPGPDPSPEPRAHGSRSHGGSEHGSSAADAKGYPALMARGDQLFSKGDLEGARKAYEGAVALRGSGSEANTGLGFTLLAEGRVRDAIPYFDRAAGAGYAEANLGLGDAYRKLGQKSDALEAYQTYLQRLPGGARATYAKAQIAALSKGASEPRSEEPTAAPSGGGYQPAGELTEPAPRAAEPAPEPAPSAPEVAAEGTL